jgi:GTP-binding protein EngB required for normal cell division
MNLRDYEQHKFKIAEILRAASNIQSPDVRDLQGRIQDLFTRLADDRFNLVVVGRFNRGKTSLMNAILATDRLPTGIVPLTSVITTVTYGSKERVILKYDKSILTEDIPIDALPQFITQQGNPGNVKRICAAEIQIPAEILRSGFYFVDTPGLGSAIVENTQTTESFFPEADAFLLVTGYESPLSEEELLFFKYASALGRRIFVVLNKHDTVPANERETVLTFVSKRLQEIFGESPPRLFSVSATDGLKAKQKNDEELLTASGIGLLEQRLIDFLLSEKNDQFLIVMCDRVSELLRDLLNSVDDVGLLTRIGELTNQLRGSGPGMSTRASMAPVAHLSGLCETSSCEICAHIRERTWNFLSKYQYDLVTSTQAQQEFANRGGFCPFHIWEYASIASPYGICNSYPALLDRIAKDLQAIASVECGQEPLLKMMSDVQDADCLLCRERDKCEMDAVRLQSARLTENVSGLASLPALCLPHLMMLSAQAKDARIVRKLVERQAALLQRLSEDMKRNTLRIDAARRYLTSDEENTAAERGLLAVAGHRNVNFDCRTRLPRAARRMKCEVIENSG